MERTRRPINISRGYSCYCREYNEVYHTFPFTVMKTRDSLTEIGFKHDKWEWEKEYKGNVFTSQ